MIVYPAILFPPDTAGLSGCLVPDLAVNASGASPDEALRDAAAIVNAFLATLADRGEPFPEATPAEDVDLDGGTLVMLGTPLPTLAA
ncbi:type II toxin-antitoxin system HicB family antitoxin [Histidinibacterium lentulum]|uniref:Type II toxin-antitoxin system HicB family antitoxin n=1 Tax=Histidinibacterium lentulum TaxID=2480588 RepID=A0A3N2R0X3_9RHOB|nr:hypothetical protein [Histidinibacterium lentulum]ROU01129.1 hypothetical protein EAT49_11435 [Histidinibacterium lentulum]